MKPKYFYGGESLIHYCKNNPQYKYNHVTKYISDNLRKDPTRPVDDIINEYMSDIRRTNTKYIINGMNLRNYCDTMNLNYDAVVKSISRAKKDPRYKGIDEDELVHMILEKYACPKAEEIIFDNKETTGTKLKMNLKKTN